VSTLHKISGCENPARKADVIFMHGLGGDAFATWRRGTDESTSWPHWLGQASPDVGVWSLGYAASPTSWTRFLGWFSARWRDAGYSMALPDRARQVLDLMVQRDLGPRPILLICHSLGGLLAKQVLRKAFDATNPRERQVATSTRAVLFLATPHAGAQLASLMDSFRTAFGATVTIEDLRAHDAHLRDLFDWYRRHSGRLGIETVTYYEQRGIKGLLPIVDATSAHPGVGADPVPLDEDHLSIAKPRARDAQVCGAAAGLLRNYVLVWREVSPFVGNESTFLSSVEFAAEASTRRLEQERQLRQRLLSTTNPEELRSLCLEVGVLAQEGSRGVGMLKLRQSIEDAISGSEKLSGRHRLEYALYPDFGGGTISHAANSLVKRQNFS
jgi:pimeloyl-ACP methyl ester carboxylesterase